jgi:hypothetical protein
VKVEACCVCNTDIKMSKVGRRDLICPKILDHKVVGTIVHSNSQSCDLLSHPRARNVDHEKSMVKLERLWELTGVKT